MFMDGSIVAFIEVPFVSVGDGMVSDTDHMVENANNSVTEVNLTKLMQCFKNTIFSLDIPTIKFVMQHKTFMFVLMNVCLCSLLLERV